MRPERRLRDDSERSFRSEDEFPQVGSVRFARKRPQIEGECRRQEAYADDEVVDSPVTVRKAARGTRRDPAAEGGEFPRLWKVAEGESLRVQGMLEVRSKDPRLCRDEAGVFVDLENTVHAPQVQG